MMLSSTFVFASSAVGQVSDAEGPNKLPFHCLGARVEMDEILS